MTPYQGELTSQEVVKLIEAETDEGGDILEEVTDQDVRGIYEQLSHEDKRRFRQFRKIHHQYFGVYGEHLPSYHMARQVMKDLMLGLPSASADVIAAKRAELLAEDRLRELCRRHGFKFPEQVEVPRCTVSLSLFADPERILRRFYVFAEEPCKSTITTSEPCSPVFKEAQPRPSEISSQSISLISRICICMCFYC